MHGLRNEIEKVFSEVLNKVPLLFTTVVQPLNIAASRGRVVYRPRGSFLVLFWTSKKEQEIKKKVIINWVTSNPNSTTR